jgi:hypothetical protein
VGVEKLSTSQLISTTSVWQQELFSSIVFPTLQMVAVTRGGQGSLLVARKESHEQPPRCWPQVFDANGLSNMINQIVNASRKVDDFSFSPQFQVDRVVPGSRIIHSLLKAHQWFYDLTWQNKADPHAKEESDRRGDA